MKELETAPKNCYFLLNEIIRIGKRLISQRTLLRKTDEQYRTLEKKIYSEFCKHKTPHFSFAIWKEDKHNYLQFYFFNGDSLSHWELLFAFRDFNRIFEEPRSFITNSYPELIEEFDSLLDGIKRVVALDFFSFKKIEKFYAKITKLIHEKENIVDNMTSELQRLWNIQHFPKIGDRVEYQTSEGRKLLKGTLVEIVGNLRNEMKIKTEKGAIIPRWTSNVRWKECFENTELCKAILEFGKDRVPECWKENRLDFYPVNNI